MPASTPLDIHDPLVVLVTLTIATGATLFVAATTSSAAYSPYNAAWDGGSSLSAQATAVDADPHVATSTNEYSEVRSDTTVAIILSPDRPHNPPDVARINRFVETGGTLVVADDFGSYTNPLLRALGVAARIDGRLVRDHRFHYRSSAMPVARIVSTQSYTHGVEQVTLNHGTAVRPNNSTVLAETSGFAYLDENRDGTIDGDETLGSYPVATVERIGNGRVVVIGDPSILINIMLDRPGNRALVRGLFGIHDHVLIDASHTTGVPPGRNVLLLIRDSVFLQFVIGLLAITGLGVWATKPAVPRRVQGVIGREIHGEPPRLADEELVRVIEHRHPEWNSDRIERIVQAIDGNRDDGGRDD